MFGEIEFFTGQLRHFSVRAKSVAQLAYIEKRDFIETLKKQPAEYEKFKRIADQVFNYSDLQGMDHLCGSCGKYTHSLTECPQISLVINKHKTLQTYNHSQD